jgi:hypothetical protein
MLYIVNHNYYDSEVERKYKMHKICLERLAGHSYMHGPETQIIGWKNT